MLYPKNYCVYDFETNGLDTSSCNVIEIGAKRVYGDRSEIRSWLVIPGKPLPKEITDITGITDGMLADKGVLPVQAFQEFSEFADGLPLVGHNIVRFDNLILGRIIRDCPDWFCKSMCPALRCVDTAAFFKATEMGESQFWFESHYEFAKRILEMRVPGLKYNLTVACEKMKIDCSDLAAHRAGADAEMSDRLFRALAV